MKYVLVTGGVVSGLGKGVTASSIGVLLKACGLRVTSIKIGKLAAAVPTPPVRFLKKKKELPTPALSARFASDFSPVKMKKREE